jgi:cullin-associated NEDD8-dissociated protein 1
MPTLLRLGLDNLKHDPNYVQSDTEEDEMPDSQTSDLEDAEDDEYDETEDYSDDDDVSWKVRRASAKLLTAVIIAFPTILPAVYKDVAPTLISRFSEREESVRVEILATFRELVRCTGLQGEEIVLLRDVPVGVGKRRRESSQSGERPAPPKALGEQLAALVPRMSRILTRQLMGGSVPTKLAGFALAREVVDVLGGGLGDVLAAYIRPVEAAMETHGQSKITTVTTGGSANESNLKIETLKFVKSVFRMHSAEVIGTSSAMDLANVVNAAISSEKFYKVVGEALETVVPVITVVAALENASNRTATIALAESIKAKVIAADVDQEVREKAIVALGTVLKVLGPAAGFEVLFDRLKIESVRLVTVKVIADVVEHSVVSGGAWVDAVVAELSTYLRRTNRDVKAASLKALLAIISKFPTDCSQGQMDTLVENVCSVLNSDDTQLYAAALDVLTLILLKRQAINEKQFEGPVLTMIASLFSKQAVPSQGSAWASYGRFLAEYARRCTPAAESLVPRLFPTSEMDANAVSVNAKALATILCYGSASLSDNPLKALLGPPVDPDVETFWLMVTGEAGKITYCRPTDLC